MPGIYGCFGCSKEEELHFKDEFSKPWGTCEHKLIRGGIIGGHAFTNKSSLHISKKNTILAVDGEISLYHNAKKLCQTENNIFNDIDSGNFNGFEILKGNLVVINETCDVCYIVSEWTGTFPLYYAQINRKFLFCSRQKPIAQVLGLTPDYIGSWEYLRNDFMYAGRTFFKGLRRLLPGQTLCFNRISGEIVIRESSRLWVQRENNLFTENLCEIFYDKFKKSLIRCFGSDLDIALMISGGWDSRLLLGGLLHLIKPRKIETYVYGARRSREIKLVEKICQSSNVKCLVDNYSTEIFDISLLQKSFHRTELTISPHWYRAGENLAKGGFDCVTAGVYGEVLGGHYGSAMWLSGWRKIFTVSTQMMMKKSSTSIDIKNQLRFQGIKKPYYLKNTFWNSLRDPIDAINDDIDAAIQRLMDRGINSSENLIEAVIAENRATQYINSQILSCRASLDIALPFCDNEFLDFSGQISMAQKIQNKLTRDLLQIVAPNLLKFPTAATLVPANFPIFFQEVSRAFRVFLEDTHYYLNKKTAGRISAPNWSWLNNEFLRSGSVFENILDDLRCDFWNKESIEKAIKTPENFEGGLYTLNNLLSRFLKIYTVDLMLRSP